MTEKTATVEMKSGLTPKALIVGIIFEISLIAIGLMLSRYYLPAEGEFATLMNGLVFILLFFMPITVIMSLLRKAPFIRQELTVIYTILAAAPPCILFAKLTLAQMDYAFAGYDGSVPWAVPLLPEAWRSYWYWAALIAVLEFGMLCWQLVWRKQWIEIERLPFPMGRWAEELMMPVSSEGQAGGWRKWPLFTKLGATGLVISVIWTLPVIINWISPAAIVLPTTGYTWIWPFAGPLAIVANLLPSLKSVLPMAVGLNFFWSIPQMAFLYLLPLDVLLCAWIFGIIWHILLPPILVSAGLLPDWSEAGVPWGTWFPMHWDQYPHTNFILYGVILAFGIMPIILNYKYFLGTLRKVVGGSSEKEEDPYRIYWLGFVVCFVLMLVMLIGTGVHAGAAIGLLVFFLFIMAGQARLSGETYMIADQWTHDYGPTLANRVFAQLEGKTTVHYTSTYMGGVLCGYNTAVGTQDGTRLTCFSIGFKMRTWVKDILIATIIGIIVGYLFTGPYWSWFYFFGGGRWGGLWDGPHMAEIHVEDPLVYFANLTRLHTSEAIGFILTAALMVLRMRFAWFPLNPAGLFISLSNHFFTASSPVWVPLSTWIAKYLVLKLGGARVYERSEKLMLGIIFGTVILWFIDAFYVSIPRWGSLGGSRMG